MLGKINHSPLFDHTRSRSSTTIIIYQCVHNLSFQKGTYVPFISMTSRGHRKVIERSFFKHLLKCTGQWEFLIFTMIVSLEIAKYSLSDESTFSKYKIYPYYISFMTRFHFTGHSLYGLRILRNMYYKANPLPIYFPRLFEGQGDIIEK